jgi:hypothetical protein
MDERKQISTQLWEEVDQELASLEEFVRSEIKKPLHSRSKEGFKFLVGSMPKKGSK